MSCESVQNRIVRRRTEALNARQLEQLLVHGEEKSIPVLRVRLLLLLFFFFLIFKRSDLRLFAVQRQGGDSSDGGGLGLIANGLRTRGLL